MSKSSKAVDAHMTSTNYKETMAAADLMLEALKEEADSYRQIVVDMIADQVHTAIMVGGPAESSVMAGIARFQKRCDDLDKNSTSEPVAP